VNRLVIGNNIPLQNSAAQTYYAGGLVDRLDDGCIGFFIVIIIGFSRFDISSASRCRPAENGERAASELNWLLDMRLQHK